MKRLFSFIGGYVEMSATNPQSNPSTDDDYVNMNSSRGNEICKYNNHLSMDALEIGQSAKLEFFD